MVIKINLRDKYMHCFLIYTKKYILIYTKEYTLRSSLVFLEIP
jgi:hypothetical protein